MIHRRCGCGKSESWESGMPPQDCDGCDDCGTTFGPPHKPRVPHDWEPRFNSKTGKQDRRKCRKCHTSEKVVV